MFEITVPNGYFAVYMCGDEPSESPVFTVDYQGSLDDLKTDLCSNCWIKVEVPSTEEEFLIRSSEVQLVKEIEE